MGRAVAAVAVVAIVVCGRCAARPRWATASANGSMMPGVARRMREERAGGAVGVAVAGRAAEPVGEVRVGVSGAKGVLRRRVRRVAVGQHHRGTLPLHAPFRAARVETFAGAGLLARG